MDRQSLPLKAAAAARSFGWTLAACLLLTACVSSLEQPSEAAPLDLPFDPFNNHVTVNATIKGKPVRLMIDTGIDPSLIRLDTALDVGLPVSGAPVGEAEGIGEGSTLLRESSIQQLRLSGREFEPFDAAAVNIEGFLDRHGKPLDGVLGYSFLRDRTLLIDYPNNRVVIFSQPAQVETRLASCRTRHAIPMRSFGEDTIPIIPRFRIGSSNGPLSIDTGSGSDLMLFQAALALPGVREAIIAGPDVQIRGARGATTVKTGRLTVPIGFGPFTLPAGQSVKIRKQAGSLDTRIASAGNKLFRQIGVAILLDYPAKKVLFARDC